MNRAPMPVSQSASLPHALEVGPGGPKRRGPAHGTVGNLRPVSMLAALAVSTALLTAGCTDDAGALEADTPCSEYLRADDQARGEAVRRIGMEIDNPGSGNPLAFANTDFNCGQNPDQSIADAIGRP